VISKRKVALVVAALTVLSPATASADARSGNTGSLQWHDCVRVDGLPMERLRCATVHVPLDYDDSGGRTIAIEISRRPADKPAQRRGVLVLNPGGPGSPALPMPLQLEQLAGAAEVLAHYDVIGFDPRGIGLSTPVTCDLAPNQRSSIIGPYARNAAEVSRQAKAVKVIAEQCGGSATADLLPHMSTANTARDLDRIRIGLGVDRISYYGVSYGSHLGAVYATLFPQHTDRVVLDSVLGPAGLDVLAHRRFAQGFDDRFPDFAKWAARRHDTYGLGHTASEVRAKYFDLANRLDRAPVGEVDGAAFRMATFSALYNDNAFPDLATRWAALDQGGPHAYGYPDLENHAAGQLHVICNDSDWPEDVRHYQRAVARDRVRHPMFGPAAANVTPCAFWPTDPTDPPVEVGGAGPANILLVQNLRDPATPLVGARAMRAALGDRAGLVTVDQGGHGVLGVTPNQCGNDTVLRFLLDNHRPVDAFCPREKAP
jgi:pimeloyl-ACP methyl ester carboxylesterase